MKGNWIITPSHWLFNAGMIGLLEVLEYGLKQLPEDELEEVLTEVLNDGLKELGNAEMAEYIIRKKLLRDDGSIDGLQLAKVVRWALKKQADGLSHAKLLHWWYVNHPNQPNYSNRPLSKDPASLKVYLEAVVNSLFSSNKTPYVNVTKEGESGDPPEKKFAEIFSWERIFQKASAPQYCFIWGETKFRVLPLTNKWSSRLFPSPGEFPNAFWGAAGEGKGVPQVAVPVAYLITCHHLAYTKIYAGKGEGVEVFLNAPSFRVMYDLNKVLRTLSYEKKGIQDILAFSLIGYALRIQRMLTAWTYLNIELIAKETKREGSISNYTLPADVARLLLDVKIARSISQLSSKLSTQVLQLLLSRKFGEIEGILYGELRDTLKGGRQSSDVKALLQLTGRIREIHKKSPI